MLFLCCTGYVGGTKQMLEYVSYQFARFKLNKALFQTRYLASLKPMQLTLYGLASSKSLLTLLMIFSFSLTSLGTTSTMQFKPSLSTPAVPVNHSVGKNTTANDAVIVLGNNSD